MTWVILYTILMKIKELSHRNLWQFMYSMDDLGWKRLIFPTLAKNGNNWHNFGYFWTFLVFFQRRSYRQFTSWNKKVQILTIWYFFWSANFIFSKEGQKQFLCKKWKKSMKSGRIRFFGIFTYCMDIISMYFNKSRGSRVKTTSELFVEKSLFTECCKCKL